jgi:hypothetical protein
MLHVYVAQQAVAVMWGVFCTEIHAFFVATGITMKTVATSYLPTSVLYLSTLNQHQH